MSESAKVRDMPELMGFIKGRIVDWGCGPDKIVSSADGVDGRKLEGVTFVGEFPSYPAQHFDTVFSSHFLEHVLDDYAMITEWHRILKPGGHLVLYLPNGIHYNHYDNKEHIRAYTFMNFMFFFERAFCGGAYDYNGRNIKARFVHVKSGEDHGRDRYSFYVVAQKI